MNHNLLHRSINDGYAVRSVLQILCLIGVFLAVQPVSAGVLKRFTVSSWSLVAHSDDRTMQFSYCTASMTNSNGLTLTYSIDTRYVWNMAFSRSVWSLPPGASIPFDLVIGKQYRLRGHAVAKKDNRLQIVSKDSIGLFESLGNLQQMQFVLGGVKFEFYLVDNLEVLSALVQCVAQRGFRGNTVRGKVRNWPILPESAVNSPSKIQSETAKLLRRIFSHISTAEPVISLSHQSKDLKNGVLWKLGKISGGLYIVPTVRNGRLQDRAVASVIDDMRTCHGRFFAASEFLVTDRKNLTRALTRCKTTQGLKSTYYLFIPRSVGGMYELSTSSIHAIRVGSSRNPAQVVDREIRKIIIPVLGAAKRPTP